MEGKKTETGRGKRGRGRKGKRRSRTGGKRGEGGGRKVRVGVLTAIMGEDEEFDIHKSGRRGAERGGHSSENLGDGGDVEKFGHVMRMFLE